MDAAACAGPCCAVAKSANRSLLYPALDPEAVLNVSPIHRRFTRVPAWDTDEPCRPDEAIRCLLRGRALENFRLQK